MEEILFHKVVPSDPDLLPELEEQVIKIANNLKLDPTHINNIALSFSEAISNCMKHGNKFDLNKTVTVLIKKENNKLIIYLKDQGKGFDLDAVPDPTKPENILKESGRGIHIMKNFLDNLHYNFTSTGTEVTLEIGIS